MPSRGLEIWRAHDRAGKGARSHGVCVAELDAGRFEVELLTVPPEVCRERLYEAPERLRGQLRSQRFRIAAGDGQVVGIPARAPEPAV